MFSGALITFLFDYFAIQKFTTNVYIVSCSDQFGKLLFIVVNNLNFYQKIVLKWIYNFSGISGHVALSKISSANGFRVNFLSPRGEFDQMVNNITTHSQHLASVGIFVDYDCHSSDKFLDAVCILTSLGIL